MSTTIMALCWPLQMPPTAKAVLVSLADNANDHGECWPSIPRICERTCFSERAVQNAIRWLEECGVLLADRSNGRHTRYAVDPARYQPPQEVHPRSTCTPAAGAGTPAGDAPNPRSTCTQPPQQVPSNRKEPSRTVSKATVRAREVLPEWLPADTWADWCDYRKGKTWTPKARELSLRALQQFRDQGHDPVTVIENAIEKGWRGLYAPNNRAPPSAAGKPSAAADFRGKTYVSTPIDQLPPDLRDAARAAMRDG